MKGNRQSYSLSFRGELYEKMRVFYGTSRWPENVKEKTLRFFVRPKQTTQQNPLPEIRPIHDVLRFS
ncbi:MAG: hypothetical protein VXW26_07850 [SAR324 cluster bacterium]|nr:hypothetical protein [SAR324 cluster bacterium]